MVVSALWLDNVEVVLAPAGVNVGIAGVLFLLPFVMGFQRFCRIALVLSNRKIACCAINSFPRSFPFRSGVFHRENPPENSSDRIGMESI